ncbi:hypothetical protein BDK51DRAFT_29837, partial [Blyttiomyces helicus]
MSRQPHEEDSTTPADEPGWGNLPFRYLSEIVAGASSKLDPSPHFLSAGVCTGASIYALRTLRSPTLAVAAAGFGFGYLGAGYLIKTRKDVRSGYEVGFVTSLLLLLYTLPTSIRTRGAARLHGIEAITGAAGTVANGNKWLRVREGQPRHVVDREIYGAE